MNPPISPDKPTDARGSVVQSTSFDAWGRRRNPSNWTYSNIPATLFSRGYTGHSLPRPLGEHLDVFGLINMNGRMYDPILARFLSVDPYVQAADNTQSYNRYSYCWNNPLAYTDPTGYLRGDPEKRFIEDLYPIPVVDGKGGGLLYDGFNDLSSFTHNGIWQKYGVGLGREAGPTYEEWVASQTQVYTGVQKIIISGKFIYIHSSPKPKNLISNLQMLYNANYGIYIQRNVTTGAFYQPYSDQLVNPSELLAGAIVGGWGLEGAAGGGSDFLDQAAKISDLANISLTAPALGLNPDLKTKPKAQSPGFNPANEIKVNNAMKKASKYLDGAGKVLGIISYIDHTNQAWQSMQNGDVWEGLGYYGLSIIDIGVMLNKSTNPYVLGSIFIYDIVDATAF